MLKLRTSILAAFFVVAATLANAQASRTWVSGVGDDANPCSRTAPCKTFAGAISKTAAGGEIDALDPGGFGAVTITKSITIDGGQVGVVSVLVSGTNGIVVQAGTNDIVTLRNLSINGIGTGINGIRFVSGKALNIENCDILGFTSNGIDIASGAGSQVSIKDTNIGPVGQDGVRATAVAAPQVFVTLDNVRITNVTRGIHAQVHSRVMATHTAVAFASVAALHADSSPGDAEITLQHGTLFNNTTAVQVGPAGNAAIVSDTEIAYGTTAFANGGGAIFSYGTNRIHSVGTVGTATALAQQ
jgi:hypothetical protein